MSNTLHFNVPTALMASLAVPQSATGSLRWKSVTVTTLCEAERYLDEAEADGFEERELFVQAPGVFVVRWR